MTVVSGHDVVGADTTGDYEVNSSTLRSAVYPRVRYVAATLVLRSLEEYICPEVFCPAPVFLWAAEMEA